MLLLFCAGATTAAAAAATCLHKHTHTLQWEDEASRIIMNPSRDGIELWHLKGGGGW
jgi:hypothetical protein